MRFAWRDYDLNDGAVAEEWMDDVARRNTGCDDGWGSYVRYWMEEDDTIPGENFWCKIISENGEPFAAAAVGYWEGLFTISEIVIAPEKRGRGYGSALIRELLENGEVILGKEIVSANAVIYPDNLASQKAFEKAGFRFESVHPDGDAWYYVYHKTA